MCLQRKKGMEGGFDHDRQPQQRQIHRRPPSESEMREPREQREPQQQAQQPAAEKAPEENEKANKNVLDLIDPI